MSSPYLSEIRIFSFNFAPKGWAMCNGQIMSIQQNAALFSLLGTTFGGNGVTTFALPNLQGRASVHMGGVFQEGQSAGEAAVTLTAAQLPIHTHIVNANTGASTNTPGSSTVPGGGGVAAYGTGPNTAMNSAIIGNNGGSQPHSNMQPYTVVNFCIALSGIFPTRN